jgi:hypothetical protein
MQLITEACAFATPQLPYWFQNFVSGGRHWVIEGLLGLAVGVISGLYSGLVVTRMARFDALKNEMKRLILAIDFIGDEREVHFRVRKDMGDFSSIASDFGYLGHSKAANIALRLSSEIFSAVGVNRQTVEEIDTQYRDWQKRCRELRPNMKVIYSPRLWP